MTQNLTPAGHLRVPIAPHTLGELRRYLEGRPTPLWADFAQGEVQWALDVAIALAEVRLMVMSVTPGDPSPSRSERWVALPTTPAIRLLQTLMGTRRNLDWRDRAALIEALTPEAQLRDMVAR